jgi:uncharacterized protein (DUF3820 family)
MGVINHRSDSPLSQNKRVRWGDMEEDTIIVASPTVLQFGKYRGLDISDVFENDQNYARWLYPQEILIGEYPEIKSFLRVKFGSTDLSYVMNWGRHKNKSIKYIFDNDRGYFDWLTKSSYVRDNCSKLHSELVKLLQENS